MNKKTGIIGFVVWLFLFGSLSVFGQASKADTSNPAAPKVRASAAFAEVVLRGTEIDSELEGLLINYTEDHPKVKELRYALTQIEEWKTRLLATKPGDADRLTLALGKLIVRRTDAAADLYQLSEKFADNHPDVKRAKRKVEVFDKAIAEILF